jgi:hypothetical protein
MITVGSAGRNADPVSRDAHPLIVSLKQGGPMVNHRAAAFLKLEYSRTA